MMLLNNLWNVAVISLLTYHVFSFLLQYVITKRLDFLYYSLFLLCASGYYFLFFNLPVFASKATDTASNIQNGLRMTIALGQIFVYTLFTIAYLNIDKQHGWIYQFFRAYLVFIPTAYILYLVLYFMQLDQQLFVAIFYLITIPVLLVYFFAISRLMTLHSNIYLTGTLLNMLGTIVSFLMGLYWSSSTINHHVPAQIGLLLDLCILSYGLSLKLADTDRQLVAALLNNQNILETERSRFASQLHQGLGSMLSSTRQAFSGLIETIPLTALQLRQYEQSLHKLDSGINELRRIAHNVLPENLEQFGINKALHDFCKTIGQGTGCHIQYECFGMTDYRLNSQTEIALYRIAQELVNNALKHAAATQVIVQLQKDENLLQLIVKDNGTGFDPFLLKNSNGSGFKSIQNRVAFLKSHLQSESTNQGTTITIQVPL